MTVATLVSTITYTGNGVSTIFTYPFYLIDAAHLQVWVNGALQPVSAYIVTSVGNQFGGEVQFSAAPLAGQQVTLRRSVPATQLVDYRPYDPFPAEVHEQALDKLTMIVQENTGFIGNAVRAPVLEPVGTTNLVLPAPAARANQVLGFDLSGNVFMYSPVQGQPGVTDHGLLSGLGDDDHPQYLKVTDAAGVYLPLTGGTLSGALRLPPGFPTVPTDAVNKAYVDTFTGSVLTKNVISTATGDAQGTVQAAWNAQANAGGLTRASNEIVFYRWKSTDNNVYRYVGFQQGPTGWATQATDWVSSTGVTEAPLDGFIYGRKGAAWTQTIERAGGSFTGKVQGFAGAAAAADLARTDEVSALVAAGIAGHVALLDPHNQYLLKADVVGTIVQDPTPAGMKQGQQWFESDTGAFVMRYVNPDLTETFISLAAAGGDFIGTAAKGVANGVPSLGADGKIPAAQLPANLNVYNAIINGDFNIWQRGTVFLAAVAGYQPDRWSAAISSPSVYQFAKTLFSTNAIATPPRGFTNCLQVAVTTAGVPAAASIAAFWQAIEGYNWAPCHGRTLTLSFWCASTLPGLYSIQLWNGNDRAYVATYTINAASVWEYKTITVPSGLASGGTWNLDTNMGFRVMFVLQSGANGIGATGVWGSNTAIAAGAGQVNFGSTLGQSFLLTGVQLEPGDVAHEYQALPISQELALCQRYFIKSYNLGDVPGAVTSAGALSIIALSAAVQANVIHAQFPARLRVGPTMTFYSPITGTAGVWRNNNAGADIAMTTLAAPAESGVGIMNNAAVAIGQLIFGHYTASAEL